VNNLSLPYTPAAMMFCPSIWCQATMDWALWSQNKYFSFNLFCQVFWSQAW
jgi:hypothetical protein